MTGLNDARMMQSLKRHGEELVIELWSFFETVVFSIMPELKFDLVKLYRFVRTLPHAQGSV